MEKNEGVGPHGDSNEQVLTPHPPMTDIARRWAGEPLTPS